MAASAEERRTYDERMATYWGRTALYRLFGREDDLLYIGIANDPDGRWLKHSQEKHWWPEVSRKTVEWFPKRIEAARSEEAAIPAERPRYNQMHSVVPMPARRHGGGGQVVETSLGTVTVESFTMTAAIANLAWASRAARLARWELGELPITFLTSRGKPTLALVPTWLAEWAIEHSDEVFKSVVADRAKQS